MPLQRSRAGRWLVKRSPQPQAGWDELVRRSAYPDVQQATPWASYWRRLLPAAAIYYGAYEDQTLIGGLLVLEVPPRPHLINWPFGRPLLEVLRRLRPIRMWRFGPAVDQRATERELIRTLLIEEALADATRARAAVDATLPFFDAPLEPIGGSVRLTERTTALVDISGGETRVWASLDRKTRQPVSRAIRMGVTVRALASNEYARYEDFLAAHRRQMGFPVFRVPHAALLVRTLQAQSHPDGSAILVAERNDRWLAAVGVWVFAGRACEFGLCRSTGDEADLVAGDLLKWEAFRWAMSRGAALFDMTGVSLHGDRKEQGIAHFKLKWGGSLAEYLELTAPR